MWHWHSDPMPNLPAVNAPSPTATVLLRLRLLQLRRVMPGYGVGLVAMCAIGLLWGVRAAVRSDPTYAPYIAAGALLTVWGMHQRRADHAFVFRHVPTARWAMAAEYSTLLLPVVLGLLAGGAWGPAAGVVLVPALAWVPVRISSGVLGRWLRRWIPAGMYEWRGFVQHTYPGSLLVWGASMACCWLPVLPMFLLGALALMASSAQEICEPRSMLLASARNTEALLRMKVFGAVRVMALLQLPALIGATIVRPAWWWIHGLFGVGMVVLVAYAVVLKYANYRPDQRLEANGANVTVAAVFAILPGLSLVPLIMLLSEWRNARANLNAFFHAHHH